jgi:hypothetical protein
MTAFPLYSDALLAIRRRADMENSLFVVDAEIADLANDHLETIYSALLQAEGETVYASSTAFTLGPGTSSTTPTTWPNPTTNPSAPQPSKFNLPADFRSLLRAEWCMGSITVGTEGSPVIGTAYQVPVPNYSWSPMHPIDITGGVYDSTPYQWIQGRVGYWISKSATTPQKTQDVETLATPLPYQIAFLPVPKQAVSVHILYIPTAPVLVSGDATKVNLPRKAWMAVRELTAADLLDKQRSDSSALRASGMQHLADLINDPINPDDANPPQTVEWFGGSMLPQHSRGRRVIW